MPKHVREVLIRLLEQAQSMPEGSEVVDYLRPDPWGDIEEFRRLIDRPLQGRDSLVTDAPNATTVLVEAEDVDAIRSVLDGLGESFAGGVPWVELNEEERRATGRLLGRLVSER